MAWTTPKTNWKATYDGSTYTGDYFDWNDENRILNNILALSDLAEQLYATSWSKSTLITDRTATQYPYAGTFNDFTQRIDEINNQTVNASIGTRKTYAANGLFIDATDLNRIERACLTLYSLLSDRAGGRRVLGFRLGLSGPFRD